MTQRKSDEQNVHNGSFTMLMPSASMACRCAAQSTFVVMNASSLTL